MNPKAMSYRFGFLLLVLSLIFVTACGKEDRQEEKFVSLDRHLELERQVADLQSKVDSLKDDLKTSEERNDDLRAAVGTMEEYLQKDPRYILAILDRDLDAVEGGHSPRGSFTDWFVPEMAQALKAGASKEAVSQRLERLITLAKNDKPYSSWVADVMSGDPKDGGGPDGIRSYAWGWIKGD